MKKVWICGIITVLCIIATVLLRKPMDNAELDYQEVQVRSSVPNPKREQ